MPKRFEEFSPSLNPDKTRLIKFGRFAAERRARRGLGKSETFNAFLYRDSFMAEPTRCCTIRNSNILVSSKVGDVDADKDKLDKSGKVSAAD
jgi:hypothetical protein